MKQVTLARLPSTESSSSLFFLTRARARFRFDRFDKEPLAFREGLFGYATKSRQYMGMLNGNEHTCVLHVYR